MTVKITIPKDYIIKEGLRILEQQENCRMPYRIFISEMSKIFHVSRDLMKDRLIELGVLAIPKEKTVSLTDIEKAEIAQLSKHFEKFEAAIKQAERSIVNFEHHYEGKLNKMERLVSLLYFTVAAYTLVGLFIIFLG